MAAKRPRRWRRIEAGNLASAAALEMASKARLAASRYKWVRGWPARTAMMRPWLSMSGLGVLSKRISCDREEEERDVQSIPSDELEAQREKIGESPFNFAAVALLLVRGLGGVRA